MSKPAEHRVPPLWLAAATNTKSLNSLPTDFPIIDLTPIRVREGPLDLDAHMDLDGSDTPHSTNSEPRSPYETLEAQLERYTDYKSTTTLHIEGDAPSALQFSVISSFFPLVRRLYIQTGMFERWNNEGFPSHTTWPLELLVISDACGEYITAEPIIKGQISHVIFYLTHNLQFEGAPDADTDPEDISKWLVNSLTGLPFYEDPMQRRGNLEAEKITTTSTSRLQKLEILENDAIETFVRFTVAHFEAVKTIEELRIRSLAGTDMIYMPARILGAVLPHFVNLKHLDLGLCHHIYFLGTGSADKTRQKHWLIDGLPHNLETLYFRGPVSIASVTVDNKGKSEWLTQWADVFGRADYLPHLRRVGFWLDQPGEFGDKGDPGKDDMDLTEGNVPTVTEEDVQIVANRVNEVLGPVLKKRGVELVDWGVDGKWRDPWFDEDWLNDGMDKSD